MEEQIIHNKDFKNWLDEQMKDRFLPYFLLQIQEQLDNLTPSALKSGDTDFIKGQVNSLEWVLERPESLSK